MAGFLLDTNVLSEFARAQPADNRVDAWLKALPEESLYVSVLTFAEIRRGIELLPTGKRRDQLKGWLDDLNTSFADRQLPVTKEIGDRWAILAAQAKQRGANVTLFDGLIAATALEHGLIIATRNVKDFAELGVMILNPWEA